jgi:pimeloyl-ACP methyl ester carboxylesterase
VITYRQAGTVLTDRVFAVPLDHARPDGEQIEVFAREVVAAGKAGADLPWLLFLQGGPGFGAPRPQGRDGWLNRALEDYRVLLLDQRGTGRSTPATRQTLARLGPARAQADYLARFRADSIVLDAELIRRELTGGAPWSVLGQSFGGFCTVTYLSFAPYGIREAFLTGGLPGLSASADDVYRRTYRTVAAKTAAHFERYPGDVEQAALIAQHLDRHDVRRPDGAPLSVPAFQSLGILLGRSTGSDELHYLLETRSPATSCPTRSATRWRSGSASPTARCTRCCTRPATRRAPRPGGPRSGSGPSSRGSTPGRCWTRRQALPPCRSPAR